MDASWLPWVIALPGHWALWLSVGNHTHAWPWPRWLLKPFSHLVNCIMLVAPLVVAWQVAWPSPLPFAGQAYLGLCVAISLVPVPAWFVWRLTQRPPTALRSNHTTCANWQRELLSDTDHHRRARWILALPGNESLSLATHDKTLALPRLPAALDGLTIAHLSDLHFTGRIGRRYFQRVVEQTLEFNADLIVLSGDLIEKRDCWQWAPELLGRLRAPLGVYFVLGNHDIRIDAATTRRLLVEAGLLDLSARWLRVETRGETIVLAGNELPWFRPAADLHDCPADFHGRRAFRIAVAHTPDQIGWARRHDFDLMLAGHTHGGQIQLPLIGPILAPSHHGVRYASGTFFEPPTLLHVSRGISAALPLRYNCPPELSRLTLVTDRRDG